MAQSKEQQKLQKTTLNKRNVCITQQTIQSNIIKMLSELKENTDI